MSGEANAERRGGDSLAAGLARSPRAWTVAGCVAIAFGLAAPMIVDCPAGGGACTLSLGRLGTTDDWRHFSMLWEAARVALSDFHQFPSWNPYHCGGLVLYQHPESPFPGPLFLLTYFWLPTAVAMKVWILAHLVCGTLGARALVADRGGNAAEQLFGATVMAACGLLRRAHRRRPPVVHAVPLPAADRLGVSTIRSATFATRSSWRGSSR